MTEPERGFGWLKAEDPRDFPMAAALVAVPTVEYRYHVPGPILDQGRTNSCVGFTVRQWMQTSPIRTKGGPSGLDIYLRALDIDEFPGNADNGTSLRAGVKVAQEQGRVERYVWAYSAEEVKTWILTTGSVVVGTKIYTNMAAPLQGYMVPTGSVLGGHAYLLTGYSKSRNAFRVCNSWGVGWSDKGRAWMYYEHLHSLLRDGGDAVGIVEKRV